MSIFKRKNTQDRRRKRQPEGVPSGGQFAADTKPEAEDVALPGTDQHPTHPGLYGRDRTEALIVEAEKVYGDPVKAVNAAAAIEVMEEANRQANLADECLARGNAREAEAHRSVSDMLAGLPAQVQGAEDASQAAGTIELFRARMANDFYVEGHGDDRSLRRADSRLEYLQRYIEREDRVRTGASDRRDLEYSFKEEGRWAAALDDQRRGAPVGVGVGRLACLTPEDARVAMAANALADLRFDFLSEAQSDWPNASMHAKAADAIKHLPEEIEQAVSKEDRISAVQRAREKVHAVQESQAAVSSVTQDIRNHLDEADRLLGGTYDWDSVRGFRRPGLS